MNYYTDEKKVQIKSPVDGEILDISKVDDYVFSKKLAGDGVAVRFKTNKITSPINGIVKLVLCTKNGVGIESENGIEVLLHINVEKVANKKGFCLKVNEGDTVNIGDDILCIDDSVLKNEELTLCVIVTNMNDVKEIHKNSDHMVSREEPLFAVSI